MDRLAMIEEMLRESPDDAFLLYAAALEHHKAENSAAAVNLLDKLVRNQPDYLPAYYQLGQLLEQAGELDRAIQVYRDGKVVAEAQNDRKTAGEINEALILLDADDEEW